MRFYIYLSRRVPAALVATALLLCACSPKTEPSAALPGVTKVEARKSQPPTQAVATTSAPRSVFSQNGRDPFFPKAQVAVVEGNPSQPETALDIPSILRANFHGVISSGEGRIAYINNVMLETGRNAVIPIRAGGQERRISVRCREVSRDSVLLDVQGYAQPIRISRPAP